MAVSETIKIFLGCSHRGGLLSFNNLHITMQKFFLYARKSTDVEDKQVLSIEAQITELREFAKRENLDVIEEFIEKQSAKIPGRPIFNFMMSKIEKGEANGIISWHPDRLARNSVDGGKIIYLLDCGHLDALKFPQFWFESTPQGKFMLNIAFGQSKCRDRISYLLSNPFYIGLFRYAGEIHEGKHQPVVSKKIFDKVQEVLKERGRPTRKAKNDPKVFCGLLKCSCGMSITAETQKGHIYYRCSRKSKMINCQEPYLREEELDKQLSDLIQKFSLKKDWAKQMMKMLEKDKKETAQSSVAFVKENEEKISGIKIKLQRLLDGFLDQDIEKEIYREEKAKLLCEKKTLEEKISTLSQKRTGWVEPMKKWIKEAENLEKITRENNLSLKKVAAKEIFGSNLTLAAREAHGEPQKQWRFLKIAEEKTAKVSESLIWAPPS